METRQSRMDKYFELEEAKNTSSEEKSEKPVFSSRLQKNQNLYKEVSSLEIEGFDLNSNSTVLDVDASEIDLEDVKEQLEEKYHENPKNKSFGDTDEINLPKINLDETREYDINVILAKAKEQKEIDYEEDRHRKVNDVLKDIEEYTKKVKKSKNDDLSKSGVTSEEELQTLIDTINAKELIEEEENLEVTGEMDPLDLLSDLKGDDDNTIVMGQLIDETGALTVDEEDVETDQLTLEEVEQISEISKELEDNTEEIEMDTQEIETDTQEIETDTQEIEQAEEGTILEDTTEIKKEKKKKEKKEKKEKKKKKKELEELDNSFINDTLELKNEDYDEFDDLKEDMKATKIIIKILIVIIVLVFIAGIIVLCNSKFNWGLF